MEDFINFEKINNKIIDSVQKLLDDAIENIADHLPNYKDKEEFINKIKDIKNEGVVAFINGEDYQQHLKKGGYETAVWIANNYAEKLLENVGEKFPPGETRKDIFDSLKNLSRTGIESLCRADSIQEIKFALSDCATSEFKKHVEKNLKNFAEKTGEFFYKELEFKGRGSKRKNEHLKNAQNIFTEELGFQLVINFNEVFDGRKNFQTAAKGIIVSVGKESTEKFLKQHGMELFKDITKDFRKNAYANLKFSGHGNLKKNRYVKSGVNTFVDEFGNQVIDNTIDVLNGKKNFGDAAIDIVINTSKEGSKKFVQQKGQELAIDAIKHLSKMAKNEIQNQAVKNVAVKGLNKLANANTLTKFAGFAYDVGKALKQLMDGEITKSEFLQIVGEKGTSIVVGGVYGTIGGIVGMGLGGPLGAQIGAAIGSSVGYFATSMLFGSVMQAFNEAEMSRKRYEAVHEFCEYSIREMESQRQQFKYDVAQFLSNRQQVIDTNLDRYERAIKNNDFDAVSVALGEIAEEFGGELQFKTFEEFDKFMSDENSVLEL